MKLAIAFILLSSGSALACNEVSPCEPPPPPPVEKPEPPKLPTLPSGGRDPSPLFTQPEWMPCCTRDNVILFHSPLGVNPEETRAYCAVQLNIPVCKSWEPKP